MIRLPHLETNVTIACQNRCAGCNHFTPIQLHRFKASMIEPADLAVDLWHFGRIAHTDAWAAIGGEPTLHPRIVEILRVARASGVADRIEVWSNGQDLQGLSDAFWQELDVLVVSAYPGKIQDEEIDWLRARCEEAAVTFELKDERRYPNFSRLLAKTDGAATREKYRACWFKTYSRVLDAGYFYRCCTSPFIAPLLLGQPLGTDGIRVAGLTEKGLQQFLDQEEPPLSCGPCAGRNTQWSTPIAWSEVSGRGAWLAASGASA